ncbi:MAG: antitoxin family protein [Planctomycetes bacterium]|nr:antitoxin family protein [Planctomycetota bacterium]
MSAVVVDAVYEDGVLRLEGPLPLAEHQRVRVTVEPAENWVKRTAGLVPWAGDADELERLAIDPELDPQEITIETEESWARRTAGMMGWRGSAELAEQIAADPQLDPNES